MVTKPLLSGIYLSASLTGPILESKGMHAIFSEKGKKKAKILENLGKNVQNLKIFWKRLAHVCDYCTLETARICPVLFFSVNFVYWC